ncbi:histone H2A-beta, sperm-like [Sceloporus undulatus]|uniref:histone H2A-beta, sperm-like n=1 Tax=Sceloporus undulatus TaxID=8520 RepID=UPI001C4CEA82|nr:histone H2A-beta, sperm-like [Sceloporus undulatus]XP_042325415.1 histone H2A-beta, sperm-like [Sceloporus undulatus]XP_042325416.1 histone H2A-beta, sperm-like [Sceloporus undulatus]
MSDSQCDTESSDELEPCYRARRPKTSRSCKAGLIFPVSRLDRFLRRGDYAERIGSGASVYMAAVLQYLTYDIVDIAGNIAASHHRRRISPEHLQQTINNDSELRCLFGAMSFPQGKSERRSQIAPSSRSGKSKKSNKAIRAPKTVAA